MIKAPPRRTQRTRGRNQNRNLALLSTVSSVVESLSESGPVRDRINFDAQALTGEPGDLHGRARGTMIAEDARVDRVHRLELAHVHQEDAATEHVLQPRAGRLENRLHVLQALFRLLLNAVG